MNRFLLIASGLALMAIAVHGGAIPSELQEPAKLARETCLKESGVALELIEKATTGDFADDPKLKCYFKCILDQFGLIENNDINYEMMLGMVPDSIKEEGTRIVKACMTKITGNDMCEKADSMEKCFYQENPKEFFIV